MKSPKKPRLAMLPFGGIPKRIPPHPILKWADLFPAHIEPPALHPVVVAYACAERRGGASEAVIENWIGMAMRNKMGVEAICTMASKGNPLLAWPSELCLRRLHKRLSTEWRRLNQPHTPGCHGAAEEEPSYPEEPPAGMAIR